MEVNLNGNFIDTAAVSLGELIAEQKIESKGIAIAVGSKVVRRADWETTPLEQGMTITVIRATQGG